MTLIPRTEVTKERLADAIELELLFAGRGGVLSRPELLDELEEEAELDEVQLFEEEFGDLADTSPQTLRQDLRDQIAEGSTASVLLVDEAFLELETRQAIIGPDRYPLSVESDRAFLTSASWSDFSVYSFLAALNARYLHGLAIGGASLGVGARLFERLVVYALRSYWGGKARHVGWPRDDLEWGPFPDALVRLAQEMRERLLARSDQIPARIKDADLDVIAWRPFDGDTRPGQSVLLCQCATGDDWRDKGIHVKAWTRLIDFAADPVKSLAFPFIPEAVREFEAFDWDLLTAKNGIPFDRLRLAALINPDEVDEDLNSAIQVWVTALIPLMGIS